MGVGELIPGPAHRDRHVASTLAVGMPALLALAWPSDGAWSSFGVTAAIAALGLFALAALWRGAGVAGRGTLLVSVAYAGGAMVNERPLEPEAGLVGALGVAGLIVHAFGWLAPHPAELRPGHAVRWSTGAAVTLLWVGLALRVASGVPFPSVVASVAVVPMVAAVEADRRAGLVSLGVAVATALSAAMSLLAATVLDVHGPQWAAVVAAPTLLAAAFRRVDGKGLAEALFVSPARLLVVSFAAICAVGTGLLALGPAGQGRPISLVDAAFTSVSATCVTGLSVLDTPSGFSAFGEVAILLLIQVGGLGIMTFAAAGSVWTGRRMSLREEATAADLLGPESRADLEGAVRQALLVTAVTELTTAVVLTVAFLGHGDTLPQALWRGVFTAISAFCNAGFALQADSLIAYQNDPFVLIPVSAAIVVGGLGPAVIVTTPLLFRGRPPLHTQVVWLVTAVLIVVPAVLYAVLEWNASLGHLSVPNKLLNAWFQSVTPRTAGFNSVDLLVMRPPTWTLMCFLMFVGGSPASTAGGIKTTTLLTLLAAAAAAVQGRDRPVVLGRSLPTTAVLQALATTVMGMVSVAVALVALQLTQNMPLDVVLFEVVSALGTVGLTVGGTPQLDAVGKVIVMACMFAGRVGPLTVVMLLAGRRMSREFARPEGRILVG